LCIYNANALLACDVLGSCVSSVFVSAFVYVVTWSSADVMEEQSIPVKVQPSDKQQIKRMLRDAICVFCRNTVTHNAQISIEAFDRNNNRQRFRRCSREYQ
jgi:hypothetical protein